MHEQIVEKMIKFRHTSFIRVLRRTLISLFPIALVGSIAQVISSDFLSEDGFIYNIIYLYNWLPNNVVQILRNSFQGIQAVTMQLLSLYGAYLAARYTAKFYRRDGNTAGLMSVIILLLISYRYRAGMMTFEWKMMNAQSIIIAIIYGYFIGQIFRWKGAPVKSYYEEHVRDIQIRTVKAFKICMPLIILAVIVNVILNIVSYYQWLTQATSWIQNLTSDGDQPVWVKGGLVILTTFLNWLGLIGPYNIMSDASSGAANANFNYVLSHSSGSVPYPFLGSTIYNSFTSFCGLALLIALAVVAESKETHQIARSNLFPVFFGSNYGLLVGLPVILNPLLLIPFVFIPVLDMIIAALGIWIHLLPTPAYPVLSGTPGLLYAFIGSNGNWITLIFSFALFAIDIWCFVPFIKLSLEVETKNRELEGSE